MNCAIVGLGKMGHLYDALLSAKYVVDINPISNRVYFSSVDEFIHYGQPVELVIVATPINTHFPIAKKLLENNYNVLVEKPICLSSFESSQLESLAKKKELILYQSTLERYNPLIKFLKANVPTSSIKKVTSYRFGKKPQRDYLEEAKFDLGIHDVDLWFYLFKQKVPWKIHVGYGEKRREIKVFLKNSKIMTFDLLNKSVSYDNSVLDFFKSSQNNPILEMFNELKYFGSKMNESWSREIRIIEKGKGNTLNLTL